jgi:Domain of unknown function (DUF4383)
MATEQTAATAGWRERSTVQMVATLISVVFVLVGIIGFVPGLTTNLYDGLEFAGDDGNAEILGLFGTSVLHNLVHLLFGLVGLALARTWSGARTFLIGGGITTSRSGCSALSAAPSGSRPTPQTTGCTWCSAWR